MADLFTVNPNNIIGGAGRLVTAAYGTKLPTTIEEIINPTTYVLAEGWKDVGATKEGIKIGRSYDEEEIEVDQFQGPVETSITKWTHDLATQLMEYTIENRQLALIGGQILQSAPKYGTPAKTKGDLGIGATIITLDEAAGQDFKAGGYLRVGTETKKIVAVNGASVTIDTGISTAVNAEADVTPITALGTKYIGFGTVSEAPLFSAALITRNEKTGALAVAVFRRVKVSGESKEITKGKEKYAIPLAFKAFAESGVPTSENVFYEIEQVI